jgi:hypothetical protein
MCHKRKPVISRFLGNNRRPTVPEVQDPDNDNVSNISLLYFTVVVGTLMWVDDH